jgi:hypothetical protein
MKRKRRKKNKKKNYEREERIRERRRVKKEKRKGKMKKMGLQPYIYSLTGSVSSGPDPGIEPNRSQLPLSPILLFLFPAPPTILPAPPSI